LALKALIIRLEEALTETDALECRALNRVLTAAGLQWTCSDRDYARLRMLPTRDARLEAFVSSRMQPARSIEDMDRLLAAMRRTLAKSVVEVIGEDPVTTRPLVGALIGEAHRDGLLVGIASTLELDHAERILGRCLGGMAPVAITALEAGDGSLASADTVYRSIVARLGVPAADCLVIEAQEAGLHAALRVGLPVVVTRGASAASDNLDSAMFVMDDLRVLVPGLGARGGDLLSPDARAELLMSLQRLHAGIVDIVAGLDRSKHVMKVEDILKKKGNLVKTIGPHETIWSLAVRLRTDAVGALVVVGEDKVVRGIISERDLARGLAEYGAGLVSMTVDQLMTRSVITCQPEDSIGGVSKVMTQRRIRHLPVMQGGKLLGLVSIGDVLGHRLDQMEQEMNVLRDYAIARS